MSDESTQELEAALTAQIKLNAELKRQVEMIRANFLHHCGLDHQIFCVNHEPLTSDPPIEACPLCQRDQLRARLEKCIILISEIYESINLDDVQPKNFAERIEAVLSENSLFFITRVQ